MQVWNLLHAARWKYRTQKNRQKITILAPSYNFGGLYLRNWSTYWQSEQKLVKEQYLLHMSSQYGELRSTSVWDLLASLRHPCKFQRVCACWKRYCTASSSERQPNFAALNRRRHLCSAGWPSRWAFAHILVLSNFYVLFVLFELASCSYGRPA